MRGVLARIRRWLAGPKERPGVLSAIEYEAVSLIAYEGRDAYRKAHEQAEYCAARGSSKGCRFWSEVAAEVAKRTGRKIVSRAKQSRS